MSNRCASLGYIHGYFDSIVEFEKQILDSFLKLKEDWSFVNNFCIRFVLNGLKEVNFGKQYFANWRERIASVKIRVKCVILKHALSLDKASC